MSDPVTNVEIEDVLSSIRRLVSSEQRDESEEGKRADEQGGRHENKLVLTPAQRVDDAPRAEDSEAASDLELPETTAGGDRFADIEDAEILEAVQDTDETAGREPPEATPEISRSEVPEFLRRTAFERRSEAAEEPKEQDLPDAGAPEEEQAEHVSGESDVAAQLENELDEVEADGIDMKELEARVAGFETAVAEQDDEWEPDGDDDASSSYAASPMEPLPWQEAEDARASGRAERAAGPRTADEDARAEHPREGEGAWYADDAILDEEALRDMVSEIVRQELQGALGERITRNVRKLVRREIHRALMSQGID